MNSLLLLAATLTLSPLVSDPALPKEYKEEIRFEDADTFAAASALMDAQNHRREKRMAELKELGWDEIPPTKMELLFTLTMGVRMYTFTVYGEFYVDDRFVTDEERARVVAGMNAFYRELYARSPYALILPLKDRAKTSELAFRGFDNDLYCTRDADIKQIVDSFNANRALWAGTSEEVARSIPELDVALFKSLIVEETCWRGGPSHLKDAYLREALVQFVRAGLGVNETAFADCPAGFTTWRQALERFPTQTHFDDASNACDRAERIFKRAQNRALFVPARRIKPKL